MNQLLQLLGSYDFFGKAVPGAALLFGMWLLLPENILSIASGDGGTTLFNLLALIIVFFILGLMIGQGVHTFADNIEKAFRWVLKRVVDFTQILEIKDVDTHSTGPITLQAYFYQSLSTSFPVLLSSQTRSERY